LFEAYLNGARVGHDVLVLALSEYEKRVFYMTYDVTKLLRPGTNAMGVMLGQRPLLSAAPQYSHRHAGVTERQPFGNPGMAIPLTPP
jgi:hypothetical protein